MAQIHRQSGPVPQLRNYGYHISKSNNRLLKFIPKARTRKGKVVG